jgi:hypothetical protein
MRSRSITASPKRSTRRTRGEAGSRGCDERTEGRDKRPSTPQNSTFRRVAVFVPLDISSHATVR